jgi:hypothetical protein
MAYLLQHLK